MTSQEESLLKLLKRRRDLDVTPTDSLTPNNVKTRQLGFTKQIWMSPIAPLPFETMNTLTTTILTQMSEEEKPLIADLKLKVPVLVSFAMNCQNIYEVERAMRKGTMVIHIRSTCHALKYQASFLGRSLRQIEKFGLASGTITWIFMLVLSRMNRSVSVSFLKSLHEKPLRMILPFLVVGIGAFTTASCALSHYIISKSTTWEKSVDYKCMQYQEHIFLIRGDLKFKKEAFDSVPGGPNLFEYGKMTNLPFSRRYLQYSLYAMSVSIVTTILHSLISKRAPITRDVIVDL